MLKYRVGTIIQCNQPGSSRHNAVGVVFFAGNEHIKGAVRYRVNWFISPSGYIRGEPDVGEYKSDWLENNSSIYSGVTYGIKPEPEPTPPEKRGRYLCMVKGGNLLPKVEHITEREARTEAERLAREHGDTVRVLQVVASVEMKRKVEYNAVWDEE